MDKERLARFLPPDTYLEWGKRDLIEKIHCHDGLFEVDHQLPAKIETSTLLQVCGVTARAIWQTSDSDEYYNANTVAKCNKQAAEALRPSISSPNRSPIPALIGRLCLPESTLRCTKPPTAPAILDKKCLRALALLAEGKDWQEAATILGYTHRRALQTYFKENYDQALLGPRINLNNLLLHAYGAKILNPGEIVSRQEGEQSQVPYEFRPKSNRALRATLRQTKAMNNQPSNEAQPFRPFQDRDKVVWLTAPSRKNYDVVGLQAYGKIFDVSRKNTVISHSGEMVSLRHREKLALVLNAMGASLEAIYAYCMRPAGFARLIEKLGTPDKRSGRAQATLLTCRQLLSPNAECSWMEHEEKLTASLRSWIGEGEPYTPKQQAVLKHCGWQELFEEDVPLECSISLMILLAYGDGELS